MFSEEVLIAIFNDEEIRDVPIKYQFKMTRVIERVLEEHKKKEKN